MDLRVLRIVGLALLLCWMPASAAMADICNDVNDLANSWNHIANLLEEDAGEDVGDLDVERLERDINNLLGPTEAFGQALIDEGNADEEDLGNDLLDTTDDLRDVDGYDETAYLVDRIDDIVNTLDEVVDYCDYVNE